MAAIPGTVVGARIVPSDTADTYPTHEADYGRGGWRTTATTVTRDAIPSGRRQEGMVVYCQSDNKEYQLGADLMTWVEYTTAGVPGVTGIQGATGVSGSGLSGLTKKLLLVGFTGGTYTQYTGLSFNPLDGYGDDPTLTIGATGVGTNYSALNIINHNGSVNRIQTGSSDVMRIVACASLEIDTWNHPAGFTFTHENSNHDPYFTIDGRAGGNSAESRIRMYHAGSSTDVSYIIADSSSGVVIETFHGFTVNAGANSGTGNVVLKTTSGSVHVDAVGDCWIKGTTVAVNVNDAGCQYPIISGAAIGSGNGSKLAFYSGTPHAKITVTGAKGSNAALGSLLTALHNLGLITDSTSA